MDKHREIVLSRCEMCGCYDRIECMAFVHVRKFGLIMHLCHYCSPEYVG